MKKILCALGFALVLSSSVFAKSDSKSKKYVPVVQEKFAANKDNKELGYQLIDGGSKVVFVFSPKAYGYETVAKVYVEGSFNGWSKGKDDSWLLTPNKALTYWTLEKSAADVRIPGNSGHPEFKFYVFRKPGAMSADEPNAVSTKPGFSMSTNNLVLFPEDDPAVVEENAKIAATQKHLADFNLDDAADRAILSNVRLVPGTKCLYRGYHPYKKSRGQYDTEATRIELVKKALEENNVHSIITLSGNEAADSKLGESICEYQQKIIDSGSNLFVNTHYNTVYYASTSEDYGKLVGQIVQFIDTHEGSYYIHCRLGTDRTGTMSAVLAAFCGADWNTIAEDYQKTNLMGIKEFRDYHLLQYSFEQILGKPMSQVENLQKELSSYFIEKGYVTQDQLDVLVKHLTTE